ncbi:hypothetical protein [Chryseobacterium sp. SIMBA_028]|uniref:hypothetical protein n=1 Tax=Chryseobacterium sp. SIMBA_028 TaxID=3085771 RepID=UPI00397D6BE5
MRKITILPIIIVLLQLAGIGRIVYSNIYGNSHIPQFFIELNILAVLSFVIFIFSYFMYSKANKKTKWWLAPVYISILIILTLIVCYIMMAVDKYS